jgi:DNA-binding YbaB/EbfC family protein
MTQNPYDALGGGAGGLDLGALLQQAQQMQEDLQAAQARLADAAVEGSVAGGAVTVVVSGTGELTAVTIAPGTVDGSDADDLADLGDMVVAAYRDAKAKADALAEQTLGPLAGGLPGMPGGGPGQLGF